MLFHKSAVICGTATNGGINYTLTDGTLTFASGETSKTIPVTLINDNVLDPNETIEVSLSNPLNATLGTISAEIMTIADTDKVLTVAMTGEGAVSPNGGVESIFKTIE